MIVKMPMPASFHFEVNFEFISVFTLGAFIRPIYWTLGNRLRSTTKRGLRRGRRCHGRARSRTGQTGTIGVPAEVT